MKVTVVDNCTAWGPVTGRNKEFPDLHDHTTMNTSMHWTGELVTCYRDMRDEFPIGLVIGIVPHPRPRGDLRYGVVVLWNIDDPPEDYDFRGMF